MNLQCRKEIALWLELFCHMYHQIKNIIYRLVTPFAKFTDQNRATTTISICLHHLHPPGLGESGQVTSKYCTIAAKYCFGSGQVVAVKFNSPFKAPPKVTIGLTRIDTHKDQNVRVHVVAESITTRGFNLRFKPWDLSITYQLGVNWMACPWRRLRASWH